MITIDDILETNRMITENKLDVRTITMGISLRDCAHPNIDKFCQNVYDKITKSAEFLVKTGEDIETEYGIPITAAVEQGNIYGCQFHPEKSGNVGLSILRKFAEV